MSIQVAILTGPALNHWVAMALGWQVRLWGAIPVYFDPNDENRFKSHVSAWNPSENFTQGALLMHKLKISVGHYQHFGGGCKKPPTVLYWRTYFWEPPMKNQICISAPTALIAICRTIVAIKFGKEVDDISFA